MGQRELLVALSARRFTRMWPDSRASVVPYIVMPGWPSFSARAVQSTALGYQLAFPIIDLPGRRIL